MRWLGFASTALWVAAVLPSVAGAGPIWEKQPPYGRDMMTPVERRIYWREFLALETDAERDAYWNAHVEKMTQRAIERGLSEPDLPKANRNGGSEVVFWRAPYFEEIMTDEERANYIPTLNGIPDYLDRWRFVAQHIRTMYARGIERGVSPPPTTDFANVFEALGELPPDAGAAAAAPADPDEETATELPGDETSADEAPAETPNDAGDAGGDGSVRP